MSAYQFTMFAETFFQHFREVFRPCLSAVGLTEEEVENPHFELPLTRYYELFEVAGKQLDPSIGLRLGQNAKQERPSFYGPFGHAASSSATVREMLGCMSNYLVVWLQGAEISWQEKDDQLVIHYQVTAPAVIRRRQDTEFSISHLLFTLRRLTGYEWQPLKVEFEHAQPDDISLHCEIFRCPLKFDSITNSLYIPAHALDYPLLTANSRLHEALLPALQEQRKIRTAGGDLLSRINQAIASNLNGGNINLDRVAQSLNLSTRTLQRRLQGLQLEFHDLVEEIRRTLALDHVANSARKITDIAILLGYSETSSFTRAFRRWTELTPKEYRQQVQRQNQTA